MPKFMPALFFFGAGAYFEIGLACLFILDECLKGLLSIGIAIFCIWVGLSQPPDPPAQGFVIQPKPPLKFHSGCWKK
jgi:hypothetical protein